MTFSFQQLRLAARGLSRTPAFTALSALTVALGIGASTAIFSMVDGAILEPLPYSGDDRLVHLWEPSGTNPRGNLSVVEVNDLRRLTGSVFGAVSEYHSMPFQFYGKGEPQRVQTGVVSDNFFRLLGVRPILGRDFTSGEDSVGAPNVILLSWRYWQSAFGGDPSVVGMKFVMNDRAGTVVGVLPPLPVYPDDNDIWMPAGQCPFRSAPTMLYDRAMRMVQGYAVLRPGVTPVLAQRELERVYANMRADHPEAYPAERSLRIASSMVREELTNPARPLLYALLASALFVLVIAAGNFANLTLSRQLRRSAEFALRAALGAGRAQLFGQLVMESLLVSLSGALIGVGIAYGGLGLLRTLATRVSGRAAEISISPAVLAFAVVTSVAVGLVAAILPMWRSRSRLSDDLRAGAASSTGGRRHLAARNLLVAVQVAVAFVVLAGAGLMVRSLVRLETAEEGYRGDDVLTARVDLNWSRYTSGTLIRDFSNRLLQRTGAIPGVQSAAVASDFPLNNPVPGTTPFIIRGREGESARTRPVSDVTAVSPGYFHVIGVPLLRGRLLAGSDRDTVNVAAVIGAQLAALNWPGTDPIGQQISFDEGDRWLTIVGVVGDVRQNGPANGVTNEVYVPFHVYSQSDFRVLVRTRGAARQAAPALRAAVHALDPRQPIVDVRTLGELRGLRLAQPRVTTVLLVTFAVIALVITAGGLSGIVAHAVAQRNTEIGIRLALGGSAQHVLWTVTRSAATLATLGLAAGGVASLVATRLIRTLLFETSTTDPWTLAGVALLLAAVAMAAAWIPARRALRVEPVQALRAE